MRHGVSVFEVLLAVLLIGLTSVIMVPGLARPLAAITADAEAHRIAAAHTRARMLAITTGRVILLRITADTLSISEVQGSDSVRVWQEPGPAAANATLTGPVKPLLFSPVGITFGVSNGTWTVTYKGAVRRVVVSRLGRVRVM
jgi:Tfp pilus assembly protein FimT